ncbi:21154_t:CDS:2, partial [Racocetra persica]
DLRPLIDDGISEEDRPNKHNEQPNPNQEVAMYDVQPSECENNWVHNVFRGFHGKTVALMSISDPKTLDDAITAARKIEAGNYYQKKGGKEELTTILIDQLF